MNTQMECCLDRQAADLLFQRGILLLHGLGLGQVRLDLRTDSRLRRLLGTSGVVLGHKESS